MFFLRDFRVTLRSFARRPGWTALAVLTLALGIGANTALFTYLCTWIWPTVDAPEPERMVWFGGSNTPEDPPDWGLSSLADFRDYHEAATGEIFETLTAGRIFPAVVTRDDGAVFHGWGTGISGDFFPLFAKRPLLGRFLTPADDRPGAPPVAVLGYRFYQRAFGGDPNVLGRTLTLDNRVEFLIVGVARPEFQAQGVKTAYYVPFSHLAPVIRGLDDRDSQDVWALGRLRGGVDPEPARAALQEIARGLDESHPREKARAVAIKPAQGAETSAEFADWQVQTRILMTVVAVFLALASVNVANLLLARAVARRREIAVRLALGSGRLHMARRIAVESFLVALAGGAAGTLLGWAGTRVLNGYFSLTPLGMGDWGAGTDLLFFDHRMVGFAFAAAFLASLLFGLAPLAYAWRQDLVTSLKADAGDGTGGRRRVGARQVLVVAQVALSVMLLLGAGLLVRTFRGLNELDPGFVTDDLYVAAFYVPDPPPGSPPARDEARTAFYRDIAERARTLPGVRAAGLTSTLPLTSRDRKHDVTLDDGTTASVRLRSVTPEYLDALGVPVLSGRGLKSSDHAGTSPVALANQAFAERYAGLGRVVTLLPGPGEEPLTPTVVGIVADTRNASLREPPAPMLYIPSEQYPQRFMSLVLRTAPQVASPAPLLERVLRDEYPQVALIDLAPFSEQVRRSLADQRMNADVTLAVGILGLLLAAVGLGSVMSYAVSRRGREIGLRMALGASGRRVIRMVLGEAGRLAVVGLVLGTLSALALGRLLESLLYGVVGVVDLPTLLAVPLMLAATAVAAAWLPARRASRISPARALRDE